MIQKTLQEIEAKILQANNLGAAQQSELIALLARLKTEIAERDENNLKPLKSSVEELRSSVEGFETSHPKLVQTVSNISKTLSDLGI